MDFSTGAILTGLAVIVGAVMTLAFNLEKRGETINGVTCFFLIIAAIPFWLFICYSIYFLVGAALKEFGQPLNPFPINILWPTQLLPFAPLVASLFCWWQTMLALPYWSRPSDLTEEELAARQEWFLRRSKKSIARWFMAYFVLFVLVQAFHRIPCLKSLAWPSAL